MSGAADPQRPGAVALCQSALGDYRLQRYPARRNEQLRAWTGADILLLDAVAALPSRPAAALVVNDEHGALCTALAGCDIATTLWTDSALSARASALNAAHNGLPPPAVVWSTQRPEGNPQLVLLRIPKQKALLEQQLATLASMLQPGSLLLAAAMDKHTPAGLERELAHWIGPAARDHGRLKAHLWRVPGGRQTAPEARDSSVEYACEALGMSLYAQANVFSREGLDIGTRFLLDQLSRLRPVSCAVDLACGNGIIGLAALQAGLAHEMWFCDESAQAIASARVNAGRLLQTLPHGARFLHGDGLLDWSGPAPELVLCNPPFHIQHTVDDFVGRRLIQQAAQRLAPGGALCMVANRHLDYRAAFRRGFRHWQVLAENRKFRVYLAER